MKFYVLILLAIFILSNCQFPVNEKNTDDNYSTYIVSKDGIEAQIETDKYNYSLDESILVNFLAINNSDTNKIHIYQTSGPLHHLTVQNEGNEIIESLPRYRTATVYNLYFEPGDTFNKSIEWNHSTSSNDHFKDLKAFSGKYLLTFSHSGVPTSHLGKWIYITETGEPLSSKLYWYFSDDDSIRLDFLVRNRISKKFNYQVKPNESIKIEFYESLADSLIKDIVLETNISEIELPPKSDHELFSFQESKEELKRIGLFGSLNCKIIIPCQTRNIVAYGFIII